MKLRDRRTERVLRRAVHRQRRLDGASCGDLMAGQIQRLRQLGLQWLVGGTGLVFATAVALIPLAGDPMPETGRAVLAAMVVALGCYLRAINLPLLGHVDAGVTAPPYLVPHLHTLPLPRMGIARKMVAARMFNGGILLATLVVGGGLAVSTAANSPPVQWFELLAAAGMTVLIHAFLTGQYGLSRLAPAMAYRLVQLPWAILGHVFAIMALLLRYCHQMPALAPLRPFVGWVPTAWGLVLLTPSPYIWAAAIPAAVAMCLWMRCGQNARITALAASLTADLDTEWPNLDAAGRDGLEELAERFVAERNDPTVGATAVATAFAALPREHRTASLLRLGPVKKPNAAFRALVPLAGIFPAWLGFPGAAWSALGIIALIVFPVFGGEWKLFTEIPLGHRRTRPVFLLPLSLPRVGRAAMGDVIRQAVVPGSGLVIAAAALLWIARAPAHTYGWIPFAILAWLSVLPLILLTRIFNQTRSRQRTSLRQVPPLLAALFVTGALVTVVMTPILCPGWPARFFSLVPICLASWLAWRSACHEYHHPSLDLIWSDSG